jgi:hypothetical protein
METEKREHHLIRLLYMILFWIFLRLSLVVTGFIAVIQWVILWFQDEPIESLMEFAGPLKSFQAQILSYLTFESDDKVFPFADWPSEEKPEDEA